MKASIFYLETAPSVNASTFNLPHGGRAKTKAYTAWITASLLDLRSQKAKPVEWPVSVLVEIPETSRLDADNPIKAALDLLVKAGIIPDDSKRFVRYVAGTFHNEKRMKLTVQSLVGDA